MIFRRQWNDALPHGIVTPLHALHEFQAVREKPRRADSPPAAHVQHAFDAPVLDHVLPQRGTDAHGVELGEASQVRLVAFAAVLGAPDLRVLVGGEGGGRAGYGDASRDDEGDVGLVVVVVIGGATLHGRIARRKGVVRWRLSVDRVAVKQDVVLKEVETQKDYGAQVDEDADGQAGEASGGCHDGDCGDDIIGRMVRRRVFAGSHAKCLIQSANVGRREDSCHTDETSVGHGTSHPSGTKVEQSRNRSWHSSEVMINLTPKEGTPWWSLLRCCRPSDVTCDNDNDIDHTHWEKSSRSESTGNPPRESCSDSMSAPPKNMCCPQDSLHGMAQAQGQDTSTSNHRPTSSSCSGNDESSHSPTEDTLRRCDSYQITPYTKGYNNNNGETIAMAFWRFLLLMMLRNVVGVDYVTNRCKRKDASSNDKGEECEFENAVMEDARSLKDKRDTC